VRWPLVQTGVAGLADLVEGQGLPVVGRQFQKQVPKLLHAEHHGRGQVKQLEGDVMMTIFSYFLPIFGEKIWRFYQKTNVTIQFLKKLAVVLAKKRQYFFAKFFGKNIFSIITMFQ
jgi:hypothetical protein